jgi:phage terminase large subunit-like protein
LSSSVAEAVRDNPEIIETLTEAECQALLYDWKFWRRPEQAAPVGEWLLWMIETGRGWGKTRTGAETTIEYVDKGWASRIALVAPTAADARDVMIDELRENSGILACSRPDFYPAYNKSNRRLVWPNGAVARVFSAEDPDQLRGPQHDFAWCDEMGAWPKGNMELTWSNLMFGLRKGRSKCVVTTTPRPVPLLRRLRKAEGTVLTKGTTYDNLRNLSRAFITQIIRPFEGTRVGKQELDGLMLDDFDGALWTQATIDRNRITFRELPALEVIYTAIDPAATSHEDSDETGIITGGLGRCRCKCVAPTDPDEYHVFILEDASLRASPNGWARAGIRSYENWEGDGIFAEVNNGGDMVIQTIHGVQSDVPVKKIHASRGKQVRNEPVAAFDEQGKVHHVGVFRQLEDQMTLQDMEHDDRCDARTYVVSALMEKASKMEVFFGWSN